MFRRFLKRLLCQHYYIKSDYQPYLFVTVYYCWKCNKRMEASCRKTPVNNIVDTPTDNELFYAHSLHHYGVDLTNFKPKKEEEK